MLVKLIIKQQPTEYDYYMPYYTYVIHKMCLSIWLSEYLVSHLKLTDFKK